MSEPPAILAQGVTKHFLRPQGWLRRKGPVVAAVDGLDLTLPAGAQLAIMGPNGAGTTTFLKLLATLLLPTRGRLEIDGLDAVQLPAAVRARVGLVTGDERSFYWRLSGRQNLSFFAALQRLDGRAARGRITKLARSLDLDDVMDAPVDTYSSGMRQRLAVARGLLHEPPLLLLDEPTRSLDPEAAATLRRLIVDLTRGGGHSVVLVTHSREEALAMCTHMGVMREGRLSMESV